VTGDQHHPKPNEGKFPSPNEDRPRFSHRYTPEGPGNFCTRDAGKAVLLRTDLGVFPMPVPQCVSFSAFCWRVEMQTPHGWNETEWKTSREWVPSYLGGGRRPVVEKTSRIEGIRAAVRSSSLGFAVFDFFGVVKSGPSGVRIRWFPSCVVYARGSAVFALLGCAVPSTRHPVTQFLWSLLRHLLERLRRSCRPIGETVGLSPPIAERFPSRAQA
jgi:hypothetical protein